MFEIPESIEGLSAAELAELRASAQTALNELLADDEADLTDDQIEQAEALVAFIDETQVAEDALTAADQSRADRLAAIRERRTEGSDAPEGDEPEGDEPEGDEENEPEGEPADAERQPVAASAAVRRPVNTRRASREQRQPEDDNTGRLSITAAADVPEFTSGQKLADYGDVASAFMQRTRNYSKIGSGRGGDTFLQHGVARMHRPTNEFQLDENMSLADQFAVLDKLTDQKRLPNGGLIAAGGWCAPSETIYDLPSIATASGLYSLPEVSINRGGINFSKGVDYATLAQNWGFLQTAAQAEAGTVKDCYEVECVPFADHRLDAIGFCITAGILTENAFPELIRQTLELGQIAHAHKVNAEKINRVSALIGTAVDWTEIGSGTADFLNALELNAEDVRYAYSLPIGATIEVVLPAWARLIARQDIAVRNGGDIKGALNVKDAEVTDWFRTRGLAVQWVYDYQPLDVTVATGGKAMPATVTAMMYPAGAFFVGTNPVISLDSIYDSTGLSTNTYTAAFFEESILVANRVAGGRKVTIALNYAGRSGAQLALA